MVIRTDFSVFIRGKEKSEEKVHIFKSYNLLDPMNLLSNPIETNSSEKSLMLIKATNYTLQKHSTIDYSIIIYLSLSISQSLGVLVQSGIDNVTLKSFLPAS